MVCCLIHTSSIFTPSFLRGGIAGEGKAGNVASLQPEDMRERTTLVELGWRSLRRDGGLKLGLQGYELGVPNCWP